MMTVAMPMTMAVHVAVLNAAPRSGGLAWRAVVIPFVRVRMHHCNLYSSR
jgi:hypothetical protein